jgi:hypothetical protein
MFSRNRLGGCELAAWHGRPFHSLEFCRGNAGIEIGANLGIGDVTHAPPESVTNQCPFIDDCLSLKILVARKGKRLPHAVERMAGLLLVLDSRAARMTASAWLPKSAASLRCAAITPPGE